MTERMIGDAFRYPFNNWKRLFNFYWVFTIVGIFSVIGYFVEIVESMLKKKYKELPEFKGFWRLFKKGFIFFLVILIPSIISSITLNIITSFFGTKLLQMIVGGILGFFVDICLVLLFINYIKEQEYEAVFEIDKVWKILSKDWKNTFIVILKQIAVVLLFILLSIPIVTLVVTIPAAIFTGYYFMVDLYNNAAA